MVYDQAPELGRSKQAAWTAFKSVQEVKKSKNVRLRAQLFDPTAPPALAYPSEDEHAISVRHGGIERMMLE
ncbi:unnamed protein product [Heligmosomoides polygyrus]|uniref:Transposase n=1 Tax=Heligmosomoides polygyrus TaxID=6339 RepID=A0A183GP13_HELPZ|nr:unnamed protein product [Heligmosomoides polygyrus]